jgi:hypothetical protein
VGSFLLLAKAQAFACSLFFTFRFFLLFRHLLTFLYYLPFDYQLNPLIRIRLYRDRFTEKAAILGLIVYFHLQNLTGFSRMLVKCWSSTTTGGRCIHQDKRIVSRIFNGKYCCFLFRAFKAAEVDFRLFGFGCCLDRLAAR